MSRFTDEQVDGMIDALKIAYALTCGMVDDMQQADMIQNAADLSCVRRHVLSALRGAGYFPREAA